MATATLINLQGPPSLSFHNEPTTVEPITLSHENAVDMNEAIELAGLCRKYLNILKLELSEIDVSKDYTADEIIALPLSKHRIPGALLHLPSRKSSRHALAEAVAALLHPSHTGSLTAIIRYNADRVHLRGWAALQRKQDWLLATLRNGHTVSGLSGGAQPGVKSPVWSSRITAQGPWNPAKTPVSLSGAVAIPMPVQVAQEADLMPFLGHLSNGGTHLLDGGEGFELDGGRGEPYYGIKGAEFQKGVVYEDGRMDLCKMVVGPDHIWRLMDSLRQNTFVRHFLLGNNIIGPSGAQAIASFVDEFPERMDTWYLAGNCIDGPSFALLVDALVRSPAVSNVWLKRNPLGSGAAHDVFRLITEANNLRTLDLDQTELGDEGAAALFTELAAYKMPGDGSGQLPLRNLYLNGNGISTKGAKALATFLGSKHCGVTSLYLSLNPLGNEGVQAIAAIVPLASCLTRLFLQSTGVSTEGAVSLCDALAGHQSIRSVDLGQAYATEDLGQAYNYIEDGAVPALSRLLTSTPCLEYLNLAHCPITHAGLLELSKGSVLQSSSLLYYNAQSILPDPTVGQTPLLKMTPQRTAAEMETDKANKAVRAHLEANVHARYGDNVSYLDFMEEEKRWLVSDKKDVRKIDSVYRNRDAGLARRRLMTLVKNWEEGDRTLETVMNAEGPVCMMRKH